MSNQKISVMTAATSTVGVDLAGIQTTGNSTVNVKIPVDLVGVPLTVGNVTNVGNIQVGSGLEVTGSGGNATIALTGGGGGITGNLTTNALPKATGSATVADSHFADTQMATATVSVTLSDTGEEAENLPGLLIESSKSYFGVNITPADGAAGEAGLSIAGYGPNNYPFLPLNFANGVRGNSTLPVSGDVLGEVTFGTASSPFNATARIHAEATEDWVDSSSLGTLLRLSAIQNSESGQTEIMFDGAGNIILFTGVSAGLPTADPHILGALFVVGPVVTGTPLAVMMSTG